VISVIDNEAVPLLKRCSLAGHAELKTHNLLFVEHPIAADMFIDVLTDRGFSVAHVTDELVVPVTCPSSLEPWGIPCRHSMSCPCGAGCRDGKANCRIWPSVPLLLAAATPAF
jgi:hypothetical protein